MLCTAMQSDVGRPKGLAYSALQAKLRLAGQAFVPRAQCGGQPTPEVWAFGRSASFASLRSFTRPTLLAPTDVFFNIGGGQV